MSTSHVDMTPRTRLDARERFEAAKERTFPAREARRRMIDWRFAIGASLLLWALIIGLGVVIFSGF